MRTITKLLTLLLFVAFWTTVDMFATAQGTRVIVRRSATPRETTNALPAKQVEAARNDIIVPVPLTAQRLESLRDETNSALGDQVDTLKAKLKPYFPDELDALSQTGKWTPEQRDTLSKAIKACDPAAVYKACMEAEPNNTAGAERLGRETSVARAFRALEQHAQDNQVEPDHITAVQDELGKLAQSSPVDAEVKERLEAIATWGKVRRILESVEAHSAVASLPYGNVNLIFNPNLPLETAVVLGDDTVIVGNRGRGIVHISKGNAAEALGMPVVAGDPVPALEGAPVHEGVLLFNPKKSGATVDYTLNGDAYVMEPGTSQALPAGFRWIAQFDRGGSLGMATYSLPDGTFRFMPTDDGWDLFQEHYDITLDNSRDPKDFHAVVDNQRVVVRAGDSKKISSIYPIALRYNRGEGAATVNKKLNFSGSVEIAINAADNLWDVFVEQDNKKEVLDLNAAK